MLVKGSRRRVSSWAIFIGSLVLYTVCLLVSLNHSLGAEREVYHAFRCICTHRNLTYIANFEHHYRTMLSQSTHLATTPVIQLFPKQQKGRPSGNSQRPPAMIRITAPAGESDPSEEGSAMASAIPGQNSTILSWLNNSRVADITQLLTVTTSCTQRPLMITPTAMPGPSCRSTPAPRVTSQRVSTCHVLSSIASGIARSPTPLCVLEIQPTLIPNAEAQGNIADPLRTRNIGRNQTQWQ
jgi:hypothetical protein